MRLFTRRVVSSLALVFLAIGAPGVVTSVRP